MTAEFLFRWRSFMMIHRIAMSIETATMGSVISMVLALEDSKKVKASHTLTNSYGQYKRDLYPRV